MKTIEQGVLYRTDSRHGWLCRCLAPASQPVAQPMVQNVALPVLLAFTLIAILFFPALTYAENNASNLEHEKPGTLPSDTTVLPDNTKHPVVILYSPASKLQQSIYEKLVKSLTHISSNIDLSTVTDDTGYVPESYRPELIITLGANNIDAASRFFPETEKLVIVSNPGKYNSTVNENSESNSTLLYMTQPYCRQFHFIRLINSRWKTISYISGEQNLIDENAIQSCANKFGMDIHEVWASDNAHLSHDIKEALYHSDLLLALPDPSIYNSKTVKNILLTSYRIRKPVIAFSRSFVNAGAIAAIHSDTLQISQSASALVRQYFANKHVFNKNINYPEDFDISFNRQVFKALRMDIPDAKTIKNILKTTNDLTGSQQTDDAQVEAR